MQALLLRFTLNGRFFWEAFLASPFRMKMPFYVFSGDWVHFSSTALEALQQRSAFLPACPLGLWVGCRVDWVYSSLYLCTQHSARPISSIPHLSGACRENREWFYITKNTFQSVFMFNFLLIDGTLLGIVLSELWRQNLLSGARNCKVLDRSQSSFRVPNLTFSGI